jgi:NAD-dependent DNA ligase
LEGSNLGVGIVTQLMEAGLVANIVDFFALTEVRTMEIDLI